jgi:GNAT superfamily N-acetyltransferase
VQSATFFGRRRTQVSAFGSGKAIPMAAIFQDTELAHVVGHRYPREVRLCGDLDLVFAPLVASDGPMLEEFLQAIPDDERRFFRRESSESGRVERWCRELDYEHYFPLVAWHGGAIVADGVLQREPGLWSSHVGRFRVMVHPDYRRRGLATQIARELIEVARDLHLHKLVCETAGSQLSEISLAQQLGFVEAARLPEFVCDRHGELHEMVLLVKNLCPPGPGETP